MSIPADDPAATAEPVRSRSDLSAGTYRCTNCGQKLTLQSAKSLRPCSVCNGTLARVASPDGSETDDHFAD